MSYAIDVALAGFDRCHGLCACERQEWGVDTQKVMLRDRVQGLSQSIFMHLRHLQYMGEYSKKFPDDILCLPGS
jgi:hypothetical protein